MSENSKPQPNAGQEPDDAPDLSMSQWREKLDAAAVRVGGIVQEGLTIRLDLDRSKTRQSKRKR